MIADIKGYEGLYSVDDLGNVYSLKNGILKPEKKNGYLSVNLSRNGKTRHYYVHRLVAAAFLPNPNNHKEVNHLDCNKHNNHVENLEWCSRSENVKYTYDVGKRKSNRETHIGNNYRGVPTIVYHQDSKKSFDNMKSASIYIGKYKHYIAERVRRTGRKTVFYGDYRIEVM